jgi:hypothetical protein
MLLPRLREKSTPKRRAAARAEEVEVDVRVAVQQVQPRREVQVVRPAEVVVEAACDRHEQRRERHRLQPFALKGSYDVCREHREAFPRQLRVVRILRPLDEADGIPGVALAPLHDGLAGIQREGSIGFPRYEQLVEAARAVARDLIVRRLGVRSSGD